MNLVTPLACGMPAAAAGYATLRRRGTSAPATYYTDAEATSQNSSGSVTLDQYGGASVYVNEAVDVVVRAEDGSIVRSFTQMASSTDVEVISPSFTGVDYVTGIRAASKPLMLSEALGRLFTSFGKPDFNVLVAGTSMSVKNAIGSVAGLFFNVQSPEYGAVADGVTNDTAAINAASLAASVHGGTVYFPPGAGSYQFTSGLQAYDNVSWVFAPGASLRPSAATASALINVDHVATGKAFRVSGMVVRVPSTTSVTGAAMTVDALASVEMENCRFTGIDDATSLSGLLGDGIVIGGVSGDALVATNCTMLLSGTTSRPVVRSAVYAALRLSGCTFRVVNSTTWTGSFITWDGGSIKDCSFSVSSPAITTGTFITFASLDAITLVENNAFVGLADSMDLGFDMSAVGAVTIKTRISNNRYTSVTRRYTVSQSNLSITIDEGMNASSDTVATTFTLDAQQNSATFIGRDGAAGNLAISFSAASDGMPVGTEHTVVVYNRTAGNVVVSFPGGNVFYDIADGTVAASAGGTWKFRKMFVSALSTPWMMIGERGLF